MIDYFGWKPLVCFTPNENQKLELINDLNKKKLFHLIYQVKRLFFYSITLTPFRKLEVAEW